MTGPWYESYLASVAQNGAAAGGTDPGGGGGGPVPTVFLAAGAVEDANASGHMASGPNDSFTGASFYMPFDSVIRGATFFETRVGGLRGTFGCGYSINGTYTELFNELVGYEGVETLTGLEVAVSAGDWIELRYEGSGNNFSNSIGMTLLFRDEVDTAGVFQVRVSNRFISTSDRILSLGEKNGNEPLVLPEDVVVTGFSYYTDAPATTTQHTVKLWVNGAVVQTETLGIGVQKVNFTGLAHAVTAGQNVYLTGADGDNANGNSVGAIEFTIGTPTIGNNWVLLTEDNDINAAGPFDYGPTVMVNDAAITHVSSHFESGGVDVDITVSGGVKETILANVAVKTQAAFALPVLAGDDLLIDTAGGGVVGEGGLAAIWFQSGEGGAVSEYRYWRLLCLTGADAGFFSISGIEFRATVGGADTTTSGQTIFGGTPDLAATSAFNDSDAFSSWLIDRDVAEDTWLGQDYGVDGEIAINEVWIRPPAGVNAARAPLTFAMQGSEDGTTWTTAWSGEASAWTQDAQIFAVPGAASPTPSATDWRILVTNVPASGQVGIIELELRTSAGGGQTADLNPSTPNGESTAKTITVDYPSTGAFGGQFDVNGWRCAPMSPGSNTWLAYEFFTARSIVEVMIKTEDTYEPLDFAIQYHNGLAWVDAGVFNITTGDYDGNNEYVATLTFP